MILQAIIEIPQGSLLKYEMDKDDGILTVDRVLNQPVPYNYGYVPHTLCGDGDPLDVFVLGNIPVHPGARVKIELLGVFSCMDNGEEDDKLVAIIEGNEEARHMGVDLIRTYLTSYKTGFNIISYGDASEATKKYEAARKCAANAALDALKKWEEENKFYVKGTSGAKPV